MTSSYASLIDLRNDTESTLPQTKLGAAAGTKGGRLGENADTGRVVLCDGVHEMRKRRTDRLRFNGQYNRLENGYFSSKPWLEIGSSYEAADLPTYL